MKLELHTYEVDDVQFSSETRLSGRTLNIDRQAIVDMVSEDSHFNEVEVHLVRPGDDIRLINVLDVVEPRHKVSGPGSIFPGLLGPVFGVGSGRTDRLTGPVVALCSEPMTDEPVYWRDSIMDMTGPAARYNLFRDNHVLVLALKPRLLDETADRGASALTNHAYGAGHVRDYNHAARMAGLRVAEYLSRCARGATADSVDVYELGNGRPGLPRVYFACQLVLHRVYGELLGWQPTLLHPNEFFDGAVFNPYNPPACGRETTYWLQNHPVVHQLYALHNREIDFAGVLLQRAQVMSQDDKDRTTDYSVKLLNMAGADGLVLTWSGSGNPGVDTMMLAAKAEKAGIKSTVVNSEMSKYAGDTGITYFPPEADAVVCAGNYEEETDLPRMETVLGGSMLGNPEIDARGPMSLPLRYLLGSTNVTGANRLSSVSY